MPRQILSRFPLPRTPPSSRHEMINRATVLAFIAAHGQTRKDGRTPQIMHPLAVQRLLSQADIDDECMHAAALLHDSVEDNPGERGQWVRAEIEKTVGKEVLGLVDALTDDCPAHLPRTHRKAQQMARIAQAPWAVKVIKLADVVASLQEGPAPHWSVQYAGNYVQQRDELVSQVLQDSSVALVSCYRQALEQPVWAAALNVAKQE